MRKVQLGCGFNRLPDWENYDSEVDISKPLPFEDNCIDFIFAEHVIEHVHVHDGYRFLKELYRVLVKGGTARLCVPGIECIASRYDEHYGHVLRCLNCGDGSRQNAIESILYNSNHQAAYTCELLTILCQTVGFSVRRCLPRISDIKELNNIDNHWMTIGEAANLTETFVLEITKPGEMPLVSVIVPTCNRHNLLPRCIRSIQSQLYKNIEIIVVADGPDPVLQEMFSNTSIRYYEFGRNWGAGYSPGGWGRHVGVFFAKGDLIAYLDDDDEYTPTHISHLVDLQQKTNADFVFSKMFGFGNDGNLYSVGDGKIAFAHISTGLILHKRELLKVANWDPMVMTATGGVEDDWKLVSKWVSAGVKHAFLNETTLLMKGATLEMLAKVEPVMQVEGCGNLYCKKDVFEMIMQKEQS